MMNSISKYIIEEHQKRKSKSEKTIFRRKLIELLEKEGYAPKIDRSSDFLHSTNIIVGNPNNAKFIASAHYDTPASLFVIPNLGMPKNKFLYFLYQLALAILIAAIAIIVVLLFSLVTGSSSFGSTVVFLITMFLIFLHTLIGPANPKNYNDNTSGIVTLVEAMVKMDVNDRDKVCFVFFDNEELGCIGSRYFMYKHPKMIGDKILINFDCVGDGSKLLFTYGKKIDESDVEFLEKNILIKDEKSVEFISHKKSFEPSDQRGFKKGIGVCALNKWKNIEYVSKIHTIRDTTLDPINVDILSDFIVSLAKNI